MPRSTSFLPGSTSWRSRRQASRSTRIDPLILNVRDRQILRVELKVSAAAGTSVEVSAHAEALSSDAAQGVTLDQQYIQNLPANGRNAESLILMTPGITTAAGGKGGGGFNANGLRSNTNYFTLDGVSMNQSMGGGGGPGGGRGGPMGGGSPGGGAPGGSTEMISIDAMQEMRVQTSSFAPEFGRSPGAQVAISSRGGTNQLHGSVFYYTRSDKFDANDWFANAGGYPRGREHQSRPGGVLGGPLRKNRTFFFVSFEKASLTAPYTVVATVPDMASRQSAPAALRPYLNAYPIPNGANLSNNGAEYRAVVSNPSNNSSASVRLDHAINSRTNLFGRFSVAPSNSDRRGSDAISPNVVTSSSSRSYTATVGASRLLKGGAINDLKLNYSKSNFGSSAYADNYGGAVPLSSSLVFPTGVSTANGTYNFSIMGFAGYSLGSDNAGNQKQINVVDSCLQSFGQPQSEGRRGLPADSPDHLPQILQLQCEL